MFAKNINRSVEASSYRVKLFACISLLSLMASSAQAGGFAVREQSTTGLGSAFAGVAAGNTPSSMYWNGATLSNTKGFVTESSYNAVLANSSLNNAADGSVDIGTLGLVSSSYLAYQVNDKLYIGLGLNAPFGFVTKVDNKKFSGSFLGTQSDIFTINANPTVAYKLTPTFTISAGAQIEYMKVRLESKILNALGPGVDLDVLTKGTDLAAGFTAGIMYQPSDWTSVGLGYRSSVKHDLGGTLSSSPLPLLNQNISAKLNTPDMATLSVRQKMTETITLMGTVEWSNWSNMDELRVKNGATGATIGAPVDFSWEDGWFYSVGAEMEWSDKLTLRTGVAYEEAPVPDSTRSVRLPDANRLWLSLGASYKWSDATDLSFGYSHLIVDDSKISQPGYAADVESSLDIISVGLKTKW